MFYVGVACFLLSLFAALLVVVWLALVGFGLTPYPGEDVGPRRTFERLRDDGW